MVDEHEPDPVGVAAQALHDPVDAVAGEAEHGVHPPVGQPLDQQLGCDLLHRSSISPDRVAVIVCADRGPRISLLVTPTLTGHTGPSPLFTGGRNENVHLRFPAVLWEESAATARSKPPHRRAPILLIISGRGGTE
jgi:hypothetical protein